MSVIAIIGATGFIGGHLLDHLASQEDVELRVLIHEKTNKKIWSCNNIKTIEGDLLKSETLDKLVVTGCTVINLAYMSNCSKQENLSAIANLGNACAKAKIKRFIHCSTACVVGLVPSKTIDENTLCNPVNEYENTKLAIEELLLQKYGGLFEIAILRPTAVFGAGGLNLMKLAKELYSGSRFVNYLKSCLFGSRTMNLVCVENVVSAIVFLISSSKIFNNEVLIISDDKFSNNNYRDVADHLLKRMKLGGYIFPIMPLPSLIFLILLRLMGKSNINPKRIYVSTKLENLGWVRIAGLDHCLDSFVDWFLKEKSVNQ
jgi:nucleoside-diphosphate-sugar epimerase